MKKRMKTCAFTGHRPQNLPFGFNEEDERCINLKKTLREQIINLIENEGITHFISGMAIGVDTVSYTHLRAHETGRNLVCRLLLEKKKTWTVSSTYIRDHETRHNFVCRLLLE